MGLKRSGDCRSAGPIRKTGRKKSGGLFRSVRSGEAFSSAQFGLLGIYCPETSAAKNSRKASDDAISTAGRTFGGLVGDIANTVIRTGATIAKSATGEVSVNVVSGYEFYLVKVEKR